MHLQAWQIAILVYFVSAVAWSIIQRQVALTSKLPLKLIAALFFAAIVYPAGVLYALIHGDIWISWSWTTVGILLGIGLTISSFNSFALTLSKRVEATQHAILSNLYIPLTVLLGVFVLHETFSTKQFLGMVLLLIGATIVTLKVFTKKSFKFDKYALYLAAASPLLSIGLILERLALDHMSFAAYFILGWGIQAIALTFIARKELHLIPTLVRDDWLDVIKIGLARAGHALGFVLAVAYSRNISLVATITSFSVPLVFIASYLILKERSNLLSKLIGVVIATIGLVLL